MTARSLPWTPPITDPWELDSQLVNELRAARTAHDARTEELRSVLRRRHDVEQQILDLIDLLVEIETVEQIRTEEWERATLRLCRVLAAERST